MQLSEILMLSEEKDTTLYGGSIFTDNLYRLSSDALLESSVPEIVVDFTNRIDNYINSIFKNKKYKVDIPIDGSTVYAYPIVPNIPAMIFMDTFTNELNDLQVLVSNCNEANLHKLYKIYDSINTKNKDSAELERFAGKIFKDKPIKISNFGRYCYTVFRGKVININEVDIDNIAMTFDDAISEKNTIIDTLNTIKRSYEMVLSSRNDPRYIKNDTLVAKYDKILSSILGAISFTLNRYIGIYSIAYTAKLDAIVERDIAYNNIREWRNELDGNDKDIKRGRIQ